MESLYGTHKQVRISWKGREADADAEIAPLVLALWQAGVGVLHASQEVEPGIAWLHFPSTAEVTKFLDLVGEFPGFEEEFAETLYARVTGRTAEGMWVFDAVPKDRSVGEGTVAGEHMLIHNGPPRFYLQVCVRFPKGDIAELVERVTRRLPNRSHQENDSPPPSS